MAVCKDCDAEYPDARADLGYDTCLQCGAKDAQKITDLLNKSSAPLFSKGAYQPVMNLEDAKSINSKYWRR